MSVQAQPLVTVGIPTYNRPDGLRRTLECILGQTYSNLEVIVSDNASPGDSVSEVMREFLADPRLSYVRHEKNLSAAENFKSLLPLARGRYFMWAADDDSWVPDFIETALGGFETCPGAALVAMEAQYFSSQPGDLPFFAEGRAFYSPPPLAPEQRMLQVVERGYGNLVYGLYRTDALYACARYFTQNELPLLLQLAHRGEILVIDRIGLHKRVPVRVYERARWEMLGGDLPPIRSPRILGGMLLYHMSAGYASISSILRTSVSIGARLRLCSHLAAGMAAHYLLFVRGKRAPVAAPGQSSGR